MTDQNPLIETWRSIPPIARDLIVAGLVIFVLLGSLWAYTGQPVGSAPLVVVESGSMMHDDAPYGRFGTIDPGDLILVRDVDADEAREDIVTMYGAMSSGSGNPGEGDREGYGHPGDVIIFDQVECQSEREQQRIAAGTQPAPPPIIHRAMTWVEVHGDGTYSYHDENGVWQERQDDVDLPSVRINEGVSSGWITQGDNNPQMDQANICRGQLIQPDWLVGKARGEIPWLGLLKFMFTGNSVNLNPEWCTVMQAHAPCDLFTMLWITLGVLIAIPLVWDLSTRFLRKDEEDEDGRDGKEAGPSKHQEGNIKVYGGPKRGPPPYWHEPEEPETRGEAPREEPGPEETEDRSR